MALFVCRQVLHNNILTPVRDLVLEKEKEEAGKVIKLAYHDMEASGTDGNFTIKKKSDVFFQPAPSVKGEKDGDGDGEGVPSASASEANMLASQAAVLVSHSTWQHEALAIVWSVRWGVAGLMPVRPHVVLLTDITLDVGRVALFY